MRTPFPAQVAQSNNQAAPCALPRTMLRLSSRFRKRGISTTLLKLSRCVLCDVGERLNEGAQRAVPGGEGGKRSPAKTWSE